MINLLNMDKGSKTPSSRWATRFLKKMHLDLFLFIDFRRDYLVAHKAMPNIPVSPRRHDLADAHTSHHSRLLLLTLHARALCHCIDHSLGT